MDDWESWLREHWPLVVGAAIIVLGHVYLSATGGPGWSPAGPPLFVAIAFVVLAEIGRSAYRRWG